MFVPLHDGVALIRIARPFATWGIIALNTIIYLAVAVGVLGDPERVALGLGLIPAVLFDHAALAKGLEIAPPVLTLVTGMFLHGSPLHLAGNMLFLWVFGDNVEDALGTGRFIVFYLAAGIGAALFYAFLFPLSQAPLIGASGAIAGVIAAYLLFYPHARVFGLLLSFIPVRIPAMWCIGLWFVFQLYEAISVQQSEVGWWAHVGGFVLGAILAVVMKRREKPPHPCVAAG